MTLPEPHLSDAFGRRFGYLRLSVTDQCNFRCNYCLPDGYQGSGKTAFLSLDEIRSAVGAFAALGTRKVRITGGEPSLRRDLPDIIRAVASTPGIDTVAMTTNGYRLERSVDDWVAAGLTNLNLSIDSLDPAQFATITGHDVLPSLLRGLDRALALGLKVKINAVLLRGFNFDQLQSFLDWVKHTPVSMRFIELMQTGDNQVFFAENHVSGEQIRQHLLDQGWLPVLRETNAGPALEFCHPHYHGKIGLIMPYSRDFCASCNRLRLSSVGKMHMCLFGEQGYDIRELLQADRQAELLQTLPQLLGEKRESHYLHQGQTGATRHLAMLGG
ncbi:GTP 3',8-cyclase MoaA [Parathalassolituus penaei]|uniref:GTP 3',8-cyclase n=1 Tax=Parathalassolituus penaei TaxID=2997323 RepID=A0A9X3ECE1_9GAMM|nr:GTP 3',8-cyclase MoaA [Parathalassolituus penaei]MCY0965028.1 GTP 3',8-cyclase MoaA [Parathalassolituus penaei]